MTQKTFGGAPQSRPRSTGFCPVSDHETAGGMSGAKPNPREGLAGGIGQTRMVRLSGEDANQIFAELAEWEQVLKDTSLARPMPPSL